MGAFILRGITTALLVTVLTLFAGIIWSTMGLGGLSVSQLLDIGLLASCLVGGYRTAKESGVWLMGGVTGAGYVTVGTLLLALFLPIRAWGFAQVLAEGALIGLIAGAFGAGTKGGGTWSARKSQSYFTPSYVGYGTDDRVSNEFDWDTDVDANENLTTRWVPSEPTWNASKDDSLGIHGAKKNTDEGSDIEWPWDRENKNNKTNSSNLGNSKISEPWEPKLLEDDLSSWNRSRKDKVSTKKVNVEKANSGKVIPEQSREPKPWWEQ